MMNDETKCPECEEEGPGPVDPLQTPETLPEATYSVILSYRCPACGERCGLDDPRALMAAMQGMILTLHCPKCQTAMRLVPPKQPDAPRIIRPGAPLNRHERRALEVVGRK